MAFPKRLLGSLVTILAIALVAPAALANATVTPATASKLIEQASWQSSASAVAVLTKIITVLTAERGSAGASTKYVDYYIGYANYTLAEKYFETDEDKADDCLDKAVKALQQAIAADANFAEAHALLASAYGMQIALHPMRGIRLGGRIGDHMDRAEGLAPKNPRVTLMKAISDYHTPGMFGGSKTRAMKEFSTAIKQFASYKPSSPLAPSWGKAQAYALRATGEADNDHVAAARRDYQAALTSAPDYAAVQKALAKLPTGN